MTLRLKMTFAFLCAGLLQSALIFLILSPWPMDWTSLAISMLVMVLIATGFGHAIGRPLAVSLLRFASVINHFAKWDMSQDVPDTARPDELGDLARALASYRDGAMKWTENQQSEQEIELNQRRAEAADTDARLTAFRGAMSAILDGFIDGAKQLDETARALSTLATETNGRMSTVASATNEASSNVATVASTAEELALSVKEIGARVSSASRVVGRVTETARSANGRVDVLAQATQRIGDVVNIIHEVAEQTNLLALNATIEAARAGAAGRGFAVVASEVKALAEQTGKATEEIRQQIGAIQGSTNGAVATMQDIVATMGEVDRYTQDIASAVEQQSAATAEISQSIRHAARGAHDVMANMPNLTRAVDETSQSASQMLAVAHELADRAEQLRTVVELFLQGVAAGKSATSSLASAA